MITRTFDYRKVKRLVKFNFAISSECIYLIQDDMQGLWILEPVDGKLMLHCQMGVNVRGKKAVDAAKEVFEWVWHNTKYETIYGETPRDNRAACMMAAKAGMTYTHLADDGYIWHEVHKHGRR